MNVACAPRGATSDALYHYTTEAAKKKDAQIAYIATPDVAVIFWYTLLTKGLIVIYLCTHNKCFG